MTVKRKRQVATPATPSAVVYSQPATTSLGAQHIMTQVVHAQQYLKEKERPLRPHEVAKFRPLHNIRSPTDLLAFLQRQTTAQGLPVKELKEGWAGALDAIDTLEEAGDIWLSGQRRRICPEW
ncbi:hypothetical protein BZA77DRAFT_363022 [Pyronema omphalodes]|nr:hypothetical protein BZA77DRAFT_363022 [Pyronema omphalodes]